MRRGESGESFLLAVDKPSGMSSHDVVNECRRAFGERRVGHAGTLDPLASGVLVVCVGPATRLDRFLVGHDKRYEAGIRFGFSTTTDDAAGDPTRRGKPAASLFDESFARSYLESIVGARQQLPPAYSAVKVAGTRSYAAARKGKVIDLSPREIHIHAAELLGIDEAPDSFDPVWAVRLHVSKGTYVRSIARDAGAALGCPAHLAWLRRTASGAVALDDCTSLEGVRRGAPVKLDPVRALGFRVTFCEGGAARALANGSPIDADGLAVCAYAPHAGAASCACTSGLMPSDAPLADGEPVCMVADGRLRAVYAADGGAGRLRPLCVFAQGVERG